MDWLPPEWSRPHRDDTSALDVLCLVASVALILGVVLCYCVRV